MQYGRWGSQRSRYLWKHVFQPALFGEMVERNGKRYRVRRLKPLAIAALSGGGQLVRIGGTAVLTGELFALVANFLKGQDREDDDWSILFDRMSKEEEGAAKDVIDRLSNDVMMGGMIGILGQPIDMIKSWVNPTARFRNPIEPPVSAIPKTGFELTRSMWERGMPENMDDAAAGHGKDLWRAVRSLTPGVGGAYDTATNFANKLSGGGAFETAANELLVRNLRKAARRFASDTGLEMPGLVDGRFPKTPRSATYDRLQDALMRGDTDSGQKVLDEYLDRFGGEQPEIAMKAIKASMRQRQPIRIGSHTSDDTQSAFLDWARNHLKPEQVDEIEQLQTTFEDTARALDLMR